MSTLSKIIKPFSTSQEDEAARFQEMATGLRKLSETLRHKHRADVLRTAILCDITAICLRTGPQKLAVVDLVPETGSYPFKQVLLSRLTTEELREMISTGRYSLRIGKAVLTKGSKHEK